MFELRDNRPDFGVQETEYKRLLGFPSQHSMEGRTSELADWTREWYAAHGRPWIYARPTDAFALADGRVSVNGADFSSKHLHDQFAAAEVHQAMLVAVSAGPECEARARELWQEGKPDEYFFMEMYGSAVVEHLITIANGRICGWADQNGLAALPHYSPGYSGWDVSDQVKLGELIRPQGGDSLPGELEVLSTGMLRPKKSLLAVVGLTRRLDRVRSHSTLIPCENCSLPGCQYRRKPYELATPQIEDVQRLQGRSLKPARDENPLALTREARYSLNARALRKWSQERLQLKPLPDGTIEAHFRYEGTTCANMGRPLEFDYHVQLGPATEGYPITDATCAPAPGDTGHTQQCEYLNDAVALMGSIANEKPLLGRPLNDVLTWERAVNPSGCFCSADRRAHKWGLVFEVLHYALVQHENQTGNGHSKSILQ